MNVKNAIVLMIDGLGTGSLGPYGISSSETDAFNRLASQSIVVDQAMIDSSDPSAIYRSLLCGGHAGISDDLYRDQLSLAKLASQHDVNSIWFGDQSSFSDFPQANDFRRKVAFSQAPPPGIPLANSVDETWMAHFFAEAVEIITEMHDGSHLAWIHCPGFVAPWDAPAEFRTRFLGPDDPAIELDSNPPCEQVDADDPDSRFGIECAYAGQVQLLDVLLGAFLQTVDAIEGETLFILAGLRGFPLGQHGTYGVAHNELQAELTQIPIFVRYPQPSDSFGFETHFRSQSLFQPGDMFATIAKWFGASPNFDSYSDLRHCLTEPHLDGRSFSIAINETEVAIRTRHWFARCHAPPTDGTYDTAWCQLYLKPDDRWNLNDVADRCPQVLADLQPFYESCRQLLARNELRQEHIPESLTTPPE